MTRRTLHLASASPRRRQLLTDADLAPAVVDTAIDDADFHARRRCPPTRWVTALAWVKARAGRRRLGPHASGVVVAADTVVAPESSDELLGKPADETDARRMIAALSDATHRVLTGVAILDLDTHRRALLADSARVTFGPIGPERLDRYAASGAWRGKAGAYNLSERLDDGWPIDVEGDHATVMGLPMRRLATPLARALEDPGFDLASALDREPAQEPRR